MSVFSKLFSGGPKGETEGTSTKTAEEGPSMQRPPNEGRGAGAPAPPNAQSPKAASPPPKSAPQRAPASQATPSKGNVAAPQPPSTAAKPAATPAAATPPAVIVTRSIDIGANSTGKQQRPAKPPKSVRPPAASRAPAPPPAVIVTRSIDIGANSTGKQQRPAMPPISIGPPTASPAKASTASAVPPAESRTSVRPTAPEMMTTPPSNGQASIADTFERLLSSEDLEAGFASIERSSSSMAAHASTASLAMTRWGKR